MKHTEYSSQEYKQARLELLADNPLCHWCHKAPATEADHLHEVNAGGNWQDGLVPSCKPCNARRGATYLNNRRATQAQIRNQAVAQQNSKLSTDFFDDDEATTPTPPH